MSSKRIGWRQPACLPTAPMFSINRFQFRNFRTRVSTIRCRTFGCIVYISNCKGRIYLFVPTYKYEFRAFPSILLFIYFWSPPFSVEHKQRVRINKNWNKNSINNNFECFEWRLKMHIVFVCICELWPQRTSMSWRDVKKLRNNCLHIGPLNWGKNTLLGRT